MLETERGEIKFLKVMGVTANGKKMEIVNRGKHDFKKLKNFK